MTQTHSFRGWVGVFPTSISCHFDQYSTERFTTLAGVSDESDDFSEPATDDDYAELDRELQEARARVAEAPVETVITNHAVGLYELAAIHLSASPPDLEAAALAIDAFACLIEGLAGRLGEESGTLEAALANIRMAFVQVKQMTAGEAQAE